MNSYYFKKEKVFELLEQIQKLLKEKNRVLKKAFDLDYKEWEIRIEIEKLNQMIENIKLQEYLPKFSKQEIINGLGKILLVNNSNPYIIFNFILSCIYTNNSVCVVLEEKMLATNKTIIELIKKSLKDLKYDENIIDYKEVENKNEIISIQDNYDLLYYLGNKEEYLNFIKRIHIDSKFENFGEIYVYMDNKIFKDYVINIDKLAYINEITVHYYNTDFKDAVNKINQKNNINKISIIFTTDLDKAYEFVKKIKSEKTYINKEIKEEDIYEININDMVFKKKIFS